MRCSWCSINFEPKEEGQRFCTQRCVLELCYSEHCHDIWSHAEQEDYPCFGPEPFEKWLAQISKEPRNVPNRGS